MRGVTHAFMQRPKGRAMIRNLTQGIALCWLLLPAAPVFAQMPSHPLIDKARQEEAPRVRYALENGAQVELTPDGKSYYLLWFPEGTGPENPPPMVATMHGHDGCAFVDFFVWHHLLKARGYGLLAIQWWLGTGEGINDYLLPHEVYRVIDEAFRALHVQPGTALLHGFSRGSTNTYAVAAMDRQLHNDYFALIIANAGKANSNYPPTREIEQGRFGDQPLAGSHWVTFAGGKDPNPERDGIQGMRETGKWIQRYGGTVELAIEDPDSGHGGFHRNPKNCDLALDVFDRLRTH